MSKDIKVSGLPRTLENDPIGFFESIKMADLEGKWMRISAGVQRRFFGRIPFGKKAVKVSESGEIKTFKTDGFGRDFDEQSYRFDHALGKFVYSSGLGVASI